MSSSVDQPANSDNIDKGAPKTPKPRGTAVTGYWCEFPNSTTEPKRFKSHEAALDYWPEGALAPMVKRVYKVTWVANRGIVRDEGERFVRTTYWTGSDPPEPPEPPGPPGE